MASLVLSSLGSSYIDEISSSNNEPSWLKDYRKNSFSIYQEMPPEVSPLYNKYTDANKMDPDQVSFSLGSDSTVPDFVKERMREIADHISIVQLGTNIHQINLPSELKSKGLVVCTIQDAIKNHESTIKKSLELADPKKDKYIALNNAFFNSGFFIYIPKSLVLEKPIHLISSLSLDGTSTISRNIVVADDNSKATIVQELYAPKSTKQQAYLELLDVNVGQNAEVDMVTLQAMDQNAIDFSTRTGRISRDGSS